MDGWSLPSSTLSYSSSREYAAHFWKDGHGWQIRDPELPPEPWWIEHPDERLPSDPEYLCEVCRHIDFERLCCEYGTRPHRAGYIEIGTLERAWEESNCAFCQLLCKESLDLTEEDSDLPRSTIYIWAFGGRPSFSLNGPLRSYGDLKVSTLGYDPKEVAHIRPATRAIRPKTRRQPMDARRICSNTFQPGMARGWLGLCEKHHSTSRTEPIHQSLALIDVERFCVVHAHGRIRYATLSYVWGNFPQVMYTKSSKDLLESPGGIKAVGLPRTIVDAIKLTAEIGIPYLWVDSLCILQDDDSQKREIIGRMGAIYGNSVLTIVDANGDHANSGLTGVSIPRTSRQKSTTVRGLRLTRLLYKECSPPSTVEKCRWFSRGWTFQEMVLSKRLLLLSAQQVIFTCDHAMYLEELQPHRPLKPLSESRWPSRFPGHNSLHQSYTYAVRRFTSRSLTFDEDVLPAFDGVFHDIFEHTKATPLFNMPNIMLESVLSWNSTSDYYIPASQLKQGERRCPKLIPSWSWAGWHTCPEFVASSSKVSRLKWLCTSSYAGKGCLPVICQKDKCRTWLQKGLGRGGSRNLDVHHERADAPAQRPFGIPSGQPQDLPSNVLHFEAFVAPVFAIAAEPGLHFIPQDATCDRFLKTLKTLMYDSQKCLAGYLNLDDPLTNQNSSRLCMRLVALSRAHDRFQQIGLDDHELDESPRRWKPSCKEDFCPPNGNANRSMNNPTPRRSHYIYNEDRFRVRDYALYNVLLVVMEGDTAYRVGMGQIHIDAFNSVGPRWEAVQLG